MKAGEALLADGNAKLNAALLAKDFQMASIAQAVIEAGQKKCKIAREQSEAIESNKKSVNRKRKQLVASASEPRNKKQRVPVQDVADNVAAVSNTVNRKNAEEHINKGPDKSCTKHKHTISSSKPKSTNSESVTKEVTSKNRLRKKLNIELSA